MKVDAFYFYSFGPGHVHCTVTSPWIATILQMSDTEFVFSLIV